MSAFGFDPSIILAGKQVENPGPQETMQALADLAQKRTQQQTQQAQLGQMLYAQQRQRTLADLVRQSAGSYSDPIAQAYAAGGFGQEAEEAQSKAYERQQLAAGLLKTHADIARSQAQGIKTPEQYQQWVARMPPDVRSMYGLPDQYDPDAIKGFVASGIPMSEPQHELKENTLSGNMYDFNKFSGKATPIGGALPGPNQSSDVDSLPPLGSKPRNALDQQIQQLKVDVSPNEGRSKLMPDVKKRLLASERIKQSMLDENGGIRDLNPAMLTEVAANTAGLISQGSPAEHTIQQLLPKGSGMKAADIAEWLTNAPQGAGQQKYLQMMLGLANREESLGKKQILDMQIQELGKYRPIFDAYPNTAWNTVKPFGIEPDKTVDRKTLAPIKAPGERRRLPDGRILERGADGKVRVVSG